MPSVSLARRGGWGLKGECGGWGREGDRGGETQNPLTHLTLLHPHTPTHGDDYYEHQVWNTKFHTQVWNMKFRTSTFK